MQEIPVTRKFPFFELVFAFSSTVFLCYGDGGKYYIPVWLNSAMCGDVKITARITGQKTASTMTRKISFACGE